jgi:hypothetical protein
MGPLERPAGTSRSVSQRPAGHATPQLNWPERRGANSLRKIFCLFTCAVRPVRLWLSGHQPIIQFWHPGTALPLFQAWRSRRGSRSRVAARGNFNHRRRPPLPPPRAPPPRLPPLLPLPPPPRLRRPPPPLLRRPPPRLPRDRQPPLPPRSPRPRPLVPRRAWPRPPEPPPRLSRCHPPLPPRGGPRSPFALKYVPRRPRVPREPRRSSCSAARRCQGCRVREAKRQPRTRSTPKRRMRASVSRRSHAPALIPRPEVSSATCRIRPPCAKTRRVTADP